MRIVDEEERARMVVSSLGASLTTRVIGDALAKVL